MRSKNTAAAAVTTVMRRRVVPFVVLAKPLFGEAVPPVPRLVSYRSWTNQIRSDPIWSDLISLITFMQSLCNACGIRNRKKRRTLISNRSEDKKKMKKNHTKFGDSLKQRLMELGREVMLQRSTAENQRRNKLGEEEQAAVLLMALSYASSVYA